MKMTKFAVFSLLCAIAPITMAVNTVTLINDTSCYVDDTSAHRGIPVVIQTKDAASKVVDTIHPQETGEAPYVDGNLLVLAGPVWETKDLYTGSYIVTLYNTSDYRNQCFNRPCYVTSDNDPCGVAGNGKSAARSSKK